MGSGSDSKVFLSEGVLVCYLQQEQVSESPSRKYPVINTILPCSGCVLICQSTPRTLLAFSIGGSSCNDD